MRRGPAVFVLLGLAVAPLTALLGQSRASKLVDSAFARLGNRSLDSAEALLRPVLDSTVKTTSRERAAALVLHGVIDFYRAQDSAAARDFRAALTLTPGLRGEWLARLDAALGTIWRRERTRAWCGLSDQDSVALAVSVDSTLLTRQLKVLKGPRPVYPERLRQAGLSGRVLVSAVIDTTGHSEPGSINIIDSPHEDFSREARRYVAGAEFQPALIGDRPTRVCTQIPVDFKITGWP